MSREFHLECVIGNLAIVKDEAIKAEMDYHFISEIDHLVATAQANKEEETK